MPNIYGQNWTRQQLRQRLGQMTQMAGCTRYELTQGFEKGVEICDIRTGSGFRFCVTPSRGMDISFAEHNGRPISWTSATGVVHPAYYDQQNLGWLRGFFGGLLTTCGLQSFSVDCTDGNEYYGLHDRISYTPATNVHTREEWVEEGGEEYYEISVTGKLRETRVFGPNITLTRTVSTRLGENHFRIHDRLENEGFKPVPAVVLYHCNFGFPVVSEHSIVRAPSSEYNTRGRVLEPGQERWAQMEPSDPECPELCFFHTMQPDENGFVRCEIYNQQLKFGGYLRYRFDELPDFTQWKMMGAGDYVCGLEPSNAPLRSRTALKEMNALPHLEPGETRDIHVELGAFEG